MAYIASLMGSVLQVTYLTISELLVKESYSIGEVTYYKMFVRKSICKGSTVVSLFSTLNTHIAHTLSATEESAMLSVLCALRQPSASLGWWVVLCWASSVWGCSFPGQTL